MYFEKNIVLLPKKVANWVTYLYFMDSNAFNYFCITSHLG